MKKNKNIELAIWIWPLFWCKTNGENDDKPSQPMKIPGLSPIPPSHHQDQEMFVQYSNVGKISQPIDQCCWLLVAG